MNDERKTKKQLINELSELRQLLTELEKAKAGPQQSEKELMDNSLDSIMLTETVGYVTKVNKHFLEMLGYSEEEVVGKFVADLTPSKEGETYESVTGELVNIDKAYLDNTMTLIEELLTKGKVTNWEAYYLRKDKKVVPIEQNIMCLYDEEGERAGAVSIIRDISERKIAENDSMKTRESLDNLLESSLDGIIVSDNVGNVTRVNKSFLQLLQFDEEEVVGKHVMELSVMTEGTYESTTGELVIINEEFFNTSMEMTAKLYEEGKVSNWESYYLRKDRKIVPVEMQIAHLYDGEGATIGSVGISRDITDRRQAEKELAKYRDHLEDLVKERTEKLSETKDYLDNIIDSSQDSILIGDSTGNIVRFNHSFLKLIGYEEKEIEGKHFVELSLTEEGTYESTTGELVEINEEFFKNSNKMIYEKLFAEGIVTNWESYYLRKDGKIVPIEMSVALLYDNKKAHVGSVAIARDITERKRAVKELKETKDYLDNIIENSLDGIIIGDSTGNIVRVNDSLLKLLGYQREEIVGKHVMELSISEKGEYEATTGERVTIGEEVFEEARKMIYEKLFEEGKISNWNNYYLRKDGKIVCIEQNIFYLYNEGGDIIGSVGINRDITDRKKQEEELKKAYDELEKRVEERTSQLMQAKEEAETSNRTKSDFLANMSHELRTPLNHIIGFTEIVVDKRCGSLNESQEDYLNDVLKSSRHLLSLINDILDLSKVEAGKFELEPTEVDPRLFVDNCLVMFKEKAMKHGIKLTSHIGNIPETITVDERKLKQIVYNILANAMKFTPDGGSVSLSAQIVDCIVRFGLRSGDPKGLEIISGGNGIGKINGRKHRKCIQFSVADSGIGIKPEDQVRIFDPFEQADGSSSRRYQGTGLGLPLTRKLVELHGGRMWVESEGEGKGAIFSFIIPTH